MKKRYMALAILLMIAIVLFTACEDQLTQTEILTKMCEEITNAKSITQEISVTKGNFTQYESSKTFTKQETGYAVTGEEKRLNNTDSDEAYTVTEINEKLDSAEEAILSLKLDESYFEEGYRLTETGLTATVKSEHIKDVFGLTNDLQAPVSNLRLDLTVSGGHLSTLEISFTSGSNNVSIVLSMQY